MKKSYILASIGLAVVLTFTMTFIWSRSHSESEPNIENESQMSPTMTENPQITESMVTPSPTVAEPINTVSNYQRKYKKLFLAKQISPLGEGSSTLETIEYDVLNDKVINQRKIQENQKISLGSIDFDPEKPEMFYSIGCGGFRCDYPETAEPCTNKIVKLLPDDSKIDIGNYQLNCLDNDFLRSGNKVYIIRSKWEGDINSNSSIISVDLQTKKETVLAKDLKSTNNHFGYKLDAAQRNLYIVRSEPEGNFSKRAMVEKLNLTTGKLTSLYKNNFIESDSFHNKIWLDENLNNLYVNAYDEKDKISYIYKINLIDGTSTRQEIFRGEYLDDMSISPNFEYIAFEEDNYKSGFKKKIHIFNMLENKVVATIDSEVGPVNEIVWSADSQKVYYSIPYNTKEIKYYDLNTQSEKSFEFSADTKYLDWASNGEYFLLEKAISKGDAVSKVDVIIFDAINAKEIVVSDDFFKNINENFYNPTVVSVEWN